MRKGGNRRGVLRKLKLTGVIVGYELWVTGYECLDFFWRREGRKVLRRDRL